MALADGSRPPFRAGWAARPAPDLHEDVGRPGVHRVGHPAAVAWRWASPDIRLGQKAEVPSAIMVHPGDDQAAGSALGVMPPPSARWACVARVGAGARHRGAISMRFVQRRGSPSLQRRQQVGGLVHGWWVSSVVSSVLFGSAWGRMTMVRQGADGPNQPSRPSKPDSVLGHAERASRRADNLSGARRGQLPLMHQ